MDRKPWPLSDKGRKSHTEKKKPPVLIISAEGGYTLKKLEPNVFHSSVSQRGNLLRPHVIKEKITPTDFLMPYAQASVF